MQITTEVHVDAPKQAVWQAITDIEHAADRISGIEKIEVLDKPDAGFVGLKWRETRKMFGKAATETMWITDAVDNDYYEVEAQSHGSVYKSRVSVSEKDGGTDLRMDFGATPTNLTARILSATMGFMFKGATEKALHQDLEDIKTAVERWDSGAAED